MKNFLIFLNKIGESECEHIKNLYFLFIQNLILKRFFVFKYNNIFILK